MKLGAPIAQRMQPHPVAATRLSKIMLKERQEMLVSKTPLFDAYVEK